MPNSYYLIISSSLSIGIASVRGILTDNLPRPLVGQSVGRSVGWSVGGPAGWSV